ncbi:hypothetical protein [Streptomyces sp. NPDC051576]
MSARCDEHPRCATGPLDTSARELSLTDGAVRFGDEVRDVAGP